MPKYRQLNFNEVVQEGNVIVADPKKRGIGAGIYASDLNEGNTTLVPQQYLGQKYKPGMHPLIFVADFD